MQLLRAAGLFAANAVWRATGSRAAGRVLVNALASPDPNTRTIREFFWFAPAKKLSRSSRKRFIDS